MKQKALLIPTFVFFIFIVSCKKSDNTNNPPPVPGDNYQNTTAGSTWNYHEIDSSGAAPVSADFTLTATSTDTSVNGRSYHIFTDSEGGSRYFNISGHDYYQYDSLPAGLGTSIFERLYLKDNVTVGTSWTQNLNVTLPGVPLPVPITITYNIAEKGISRTVNGINYTDVIHVTTSISSTIIPAASLISDIHGYYAEKYGLIEAKTVVQLDFLGITDNVNIETKLVSAHLL